MIEHDNLRFADTIAVLYNLKKQYGHQTLQESYDLLAQQDLDTIMSVLRSAYCVANKVDLSIDAFAQLISETGLGVLKVIDLYGRVVGAILSSGLTPEEYQQRKNVLGGL